MTTRALSTTQILSHLVATLASAADIPLASPQPAGNARWSEAARAALGGAPAAA